MKRFIFSFLILSLLSLNLIAQEADELERLFFDLPDIQFKRLDDHGGLPCYLLKVKQAVDHQDPSQGYFYQRVWLVHRSFDNNTVINTNGYNLNSRTMELFDLLQANYISVEHRYFGPSTPDPKDWKFLSIQQAAADYHHIKTLLGQIYKKKWASTGISKGGETCTYYKHFYPDDIAVSIPYVAPFPNDLKDKRLYAFLDTMGTDVCRQNILDFQKRVLKNKEQLAPLLKYYLKGKGQTMNIIGGPESALELFVMEYPFGLWQNGLDCANVPSVQTSPEAHLDHLLDDAGFGYLEDAASIELAAHYYQHATQLGYYGYRTEPFGDLLEHWNGEPSACFFPEGTLKYDGSVRNQLTAWLQKDATDIIFLYGANDTWTAAQSEIGRNTKVKKYIFSGKHHGNARIKEVDEGLQKEILDWIRERL